ncbi:thioredoxin [Streptacidiphilus jiangxiensis]|uniref:Thioredoxin n=1 Tax=Streptacidiphilus jiangxiensis TaxID=235985 RepID=A0A1H7JAJ3_STRJI|nr:thioredoxin [Streptacidiphilus jiangxiensis]SEK70990.1 thioredoxin 1 [Streptacidiphilus jiangxiensis]
MAGTTEHVAAVTDADFAQRVLASGRPVLVEFTADWCPPCRMMAPVLAELAAERRGELDVVALDVDTNPQVQGRYGVLSMPTLMLFRDGEPIWTAVGARAKRRLGQELTEALARMA